MVTKEAFRRKDVTKVIFEALFKVFMYRSKKRHAKLVPGYDVVVVKRGSIFTLGMRAALGRHGQDRDGTEIHVCHHTQTLPATDHHHTDG
jgi:hypothetical protein